MRPPPPHFQCEVFAQQIQFGRQPFTSNEGFNPLVGRFPEIEEDEAPYRLLCNEYLKAE